MPSHIPDDALWKRKREEEEEEMEVTEELVADLTEMNVEQTRDGRSSSSSPETQQKPQQKRIVDPNPRDAKRRQPLANFGGLSAALEQADLPDYESSDDEGMIVLRESLAETNEEKDKEIAELRRLVGVLQDKYNTAAEELVEVRVECNQLENERLLNRRFIDNLTDSLDEEQKLYTKKCNALYEAEARIEEQAAELASLKGAQGSETQQLKEEVLELRVYKDTCFGELTRLKEENNALKASRQDHIVEAQNREIAELKEINQRAAALNEELKQVLQKSDQDLAQARSFATEQTRIASQAEQALKEERASRSDDAAHRTSRLEEQVTTLQQEKSVAEETARKQLEQLKANADREKAKLVSAHQLQIAELKSHAERQHEEVVQHLQAAAEHQHEQIVARLQNDHNNQVHQLMAFAEYHYRQSENERERLVRDYHTETQQLVAIAERAYAEVVSQRDQALAGVRSHQGHLQAIQAY
ncbi:hypothetical protein NKR23_g1991 [Pleurostoma richardsiae]|uniref:Uncharacterized protein n=1 Tax=Pleurostoma richardsiae TaxID=41990 RepID=A0AA38RNG4_9PEZI|nr:hypothetical protein NKR23_g1991 [Pleurostoma richardsiae]